MYEYNEIDKILKKLLNNEILAIPTDTVYGLMAIASKDNEIKINELKNSPTTKKISLIFSDVDTLMQSIDVEKTYNTNLIKKYLPGKYTFIVHLKQSIVKDKFDRTDFGVRVTSNEALQNLIFKTGILLASSCNKSGEDVCINSSQVRQKFPNIGIVLGGINQGYLSSSIIDLTKKESIQVR